MQENYSSQQDIKSLSEKLTLSGRDYELLNKESTACVNIRFIGAFNNRHVVWNAKIQTLKNKFNARLQSLAAGTEEHQLRQSIDISQNNDHYAINIALNLQQIDEAAIKRTIIMIRKYKRLHSGCHEYGETITFKTD